ncbi:TetR/AcrR family transcriptional regulator [Leucobacter massiliensis]|uniref:HTH tetR-type domain-containing protein n=1 Tax=Leucobacter massiliensis TaxID=1686285 RepID=A0A2S9QN52_9MICO|nr:TetR/AcrR family transcriptional regulator [Leucobacter massiliensis]PRI11022.1 hypothetical protein B4915_09120 [Leucobacter massiliensis]
MPRSRRPGLTRETIVAAALELAAQNREPTLGAVSRKLGVHITSLYNHVEDRQDLINAVRAAISAEHAGRVLPEGWEAVLRLLAAGMRDMFARYPGVIVPFATTPVGGSPVAPLYERLTEALVRDGIPRPGAEHAIHALNALVIGVALDSLDPDTDPVASRSALELGVEGLILRLRAMAGSRSG